MRTTRVRVLAMLILAGPAGIPADSLARVDPAWLESWIEAQAQRPATMAASGRIAATSEPGTAMIIHGQVLAPDGSPAGGVVVHAYHRDSDGFEFGRGDASLTTWRLQGWVETDSDGRFEFSTIRPAPDHLGREAAHIHFTLESTEFGRQWAPTVYFADDPLVTVERHRRSEAAGAFGSVRDVRKANGVQHVDVKFRLREKADF